MQPTNGELVRNFFEIIWNQRRIDLIGDYIGPESVLHADHADVVGPDEFIVQQYKPFTTAFPDLRVEVTAVVEQGETVIARWVAVGTHTSDGLGFAPTARRVEFRGISWIEGKDGKFGHGWQSSNIEDVIRMLARASGE